MSAPARASGAVAALCALGACARPAHRVSGLLEAGWYGEACLAAEASGDAVLVERVRSATLAAAAPRVALRPARPEEQRDRLVGYGERWVAMAMELETREMPFSSVDVGLRLEDAAGRAWTVCPPTECDAAWLGERVLPDAAREARRVGPAPSDGWPPLGRLLGVLVLATTLPVALALDVVTAPAMLLAGEQPMFTRLALDAVQAVAGDGPGEPELAEPGPCTTSPCAREWIVVAEEGAGLPTTARVALSWSHRPACGASFEEAIPLGEGDLARRVHDAFGSGRALGALR